MKKIFQSLIITLITLCSFPIFAQLKSDVEYPASMVSGTLPVVYVNTENSVPIVDKINPIPAGLYIECPEGSKYENVGTLESPVDLTIRGRGNTTWELPKKPYKLKFDKKTALLGMPKSKHFALMAFCSNGADWAYNFLGFNMARDLEMGWQPSFVPVELVLNGSYEGVYWLCETIKIDENRLNIFEQEDGETDIEKIPYGWLLEIDNYDDDNQIKFEETEGRKIRFTLQSPEELSGAQRNWLEPELKKINDLIYDSTDLNSSSWTKFIDIENVVKYFIVRELLHDYDAYCGSFYLHKDKSDDAKWKFGPIWDCEMNSLEKNCYSVHNRPDYWYSSMHWMDQMMKFPIFTETFKRVWSDYYNSGKINKMLDNLKEFSKDLDKAFKQNNVRWAEMEHWRQYKREDALETCNTGLKNNSKWMNENQDILVYLANIPFIEDIPDSYFKLKGDYIFVDKEYIDLFSLFISDIHGLNVKKLDKEIINISDFCSGVYIIMGKTKSGKKVSYKFIR